MAAKTRREPVKALGRMYVSGSTRYTSTGSTKKHPRLKTAATTYGIGFAGATVGSAVGAMAGPHGRHAGSFMGGAAGMAAGRHIARKQGWQTRTKQRMSVRAFKHLSGH